MSQRSQNLANVAAIARGLGDVVHEVAFVGGAVTALYIDDPGAGDVRMTDDVDCVIEVLQDRSRWQSRQ